MKLWPVVIGGTFGGIQGGISGVLGAPLWLICLAAVPLAIALSTGSSPQE
jgi:hypothetical protein